MSQTDQKHMTANTTDSDNEKTSKVINILFGKLKSLFPAYHLSWPNQDVFNRAKKEWLTAFIVAKINDINMIEGGVQKCRESGSPFIPSVGQFISWCKPTIEELGLPSLNDAYAAAIKNSSPYETKKDWPHFTVRHAARLTGSHQLTTKPEKETRSIFEENYKRAIQDFLNGKLNQEIEVQKEIDKTRLEQQGKEAGDSIVEGVTAVGTLSLKELLATLKTK